MKVKAITLGFDGMQRRRPGEVFELSNPKHFSKRWMELVEEEVEAPVKAKAEPAKLGKPGQVHQAQTHHVPVDPQKPSGAAAVI